MMYSGVYAAMVSSRVAIVLVEEVMVRLDVSITSNKEEQIGRKTKYLRTRPEIFMFMDEVGCYTSQKMMAIMAAKNLLFKMAQEPC